jgi:FMN reductase
MSNNLTVGCSGNLSRPSPRGLCRKRDGRAVEATQVAARSLYIEDLGPSRADADLNPEARKIIQAIIETEALVICSPAHEGSCIGPSKHVFDLLDLPICTASRLS